MFKANAGTAANTWMGNTNTDKNPPTTTYTNRASHLDSRIIEHGLVSLLCNHSYMQHDFPLVTWKHTHRHTHAYQKPLLNASTHISPKELKQWEGSLNQNNEMETISHAGLLASHPPTP